MKSRTTALSVVFLLLAALPAACEDRLLIMAPNEFLDALAPLRKFKEASLRRTWLLGLDQVYASFPAVDAAESVKRCILWHHEMDGVTHVMMVGDIAHFPARYRFWGRYMPNDGYFRGTWYVGRGQYHQSNETDAKPFCSWVSVGASEYSIDVDCETFSGDAAARQVRLYYADAEVAGSAFRIEFRPTEVCLVACGTTVVAPYNWMLNTTYHVTAAVQPNRVVVSVNGSQVIDQTLANAVPTSGQIGLGTWLSHSVFDNFRVRSGETTLLREDFNDGVANGFTDAPTMEERGWAVSDLYYANLYRSVPDWPYYEFDTWDGNSNGLYGEIEWNPDPNNCSPNCKALNNDQIGYLAHVAVGRVPASSVQEVQRYVNKVLLYEMGARADAPWFKKASLYEGTTGGGGSNDNIATYLASQGFAVSNLRWSYLQNQPNRSAIVASDINAGVGMINYTGHGNKTEWSCMGFLSADVNSLTNGNQRWQLPVVLAAACFTGQFAPLPPSDGWTDGNQQPHGGTSVCERLPVDPSGIAPSCLQPGRTVSCMGNAFLFDGGPDGAGGAIAYLGERSAGRAWCDSLAQLFYGAYTPDVSVGQMWETMIEGYYDANNLSQSGYWIYGENKWEEGHMFDEPQKLILFGDPSVLVGGAFNNYRGGAMWDTYEPWNGPFWGGTRYRIVENTVVPPGYLLRAFEGTSLFFEPGKSIVGWGPLGFLAAASHGSPTWFLSLGPEPQRERVIHGMKIGGQFRLLNGGQVKLY